MASTIVQLQQQLKSLFPSQTSVWLSIQLQTLSFTCYEVTNSDEYSNKQSKNTAGFRRNQVLRCQGKLKTLLLESMLLYGYENNIYFLTIS